MSARKLVLAVLAFALAGCEAAPSDVVNAQESRVCAAHGGVWVSEWNAITTANGTFRCLRPVLYVDSVAARPAETPEGR